MSNTAPEQQDTAFLWVENKENNDGAVRKQIRQHLMHNFFRQKRSRAIGRQSVTSPLKWSRRAPVDTTAPERPAEPMFLDVLGHEGHARLKALREQKLSLEGVLDSEDVVNTDVDREETQNSSYSNELTVAHLDAIASSSRSMTQSRMLAWPKNSHSNALAQRLTKQAPLPPNNSTLQAVLGMLTQPEVLIGNRFDPFHSLPTQCTREDQLALQCSKSKQHLLESVELLTCHSIRCSPRDTVRVPPRCRMGARPQHALPTGPRSPVDVPLLPGIGGYFLYPRRRCAESILHSSTSKPGLQIDQRGSVGPRPEDERWRLPECDDGADRRGSTPGHGRIEGAPQWPAVAPEAARWKDVLIRQTVPRHDTPWLAPCWACARYHLVAR